MADSSRIPLHKREIVSESAAQTIDRYRVEGGWLYHARGYCAAALCFVPDTAAKSDSPT